MRVLINRISAAGRKTGVGHFTCQLVRALREQAGADAIGVFPGRKLWPAVNVYARLGPFLKKFVTRARKMRSAHRYWAALGALPTALARSLYHASQRGFNHYVRGLMEGGTFDLYHEPNFIPYASPLKTVITLHDFSVLLYPHWHPPARVKRYENKFRQGLAQATHFFTDADFIRQQAIKLLHLPAERITRVYPGINSAYRPLPEAEVKADLKRLGLKPGYLLYLGTIEPRKNVRMLLEAYCSLPAGLRERCPLLLAGGWGWQTEDVAKFYREEARHQGVQHLGYVADRHLPALYNGARALVYPSYYEGFGLPPIEMMACGGAVLASTAETLVETVGRQAHLTDPNDLDGWRDALARVIADQDWWQSLRDGAIETARAFSWERCAAETLEVYRQVLAGPRRLAQAA